MISSFYVFKSFTIFIPFAGISFVKLHSKPQFFLHWKAFVVIDLRLLVNGYQIMVNDWFLDFYVVFVGKIIYDEIYIFFVGFRKRKFYSSVLNITN
jgi:hypothetical protein